MTVLMPGGFKPPHGGHVALATKFANRPDVENVTIMVGPVGRSGITRKQSLLVWRLLANHPKIQIVSVDNSNPMHAAFEYVFNLPDDSNMVVSLGASSKNVKDANRSRVFKSAIDNYKTNATKDGKKTPEGVTAVDLTDSAITRYSGRNDSYDGSPISGTVLRSDLSNGDFEKFKTNYPGYEEVTLRKIFDSLAIQVNRHVKEALRTVVNNVIEEEGIKIIDTDNLDGAIEKIQAASDETGELEKSIGK